MGTNAGTAELYDRGADRLVGSRCLLCAAVHFPPLEGCPDCFASTSERVPLSTEGRVRASTVVDLNFPGFPSGYLLVEVEFPEGIVVLGQLVPDAGQATVEQGMTVRAEWGQVRTTDGGDPVAGYRFRPGGQP